MAAWHSSTPGLGAITSEVVVVDGLGPPGLGVRDRAPQLEDEVVSEAEGLEVRAVDGLHQLHRVRFSLSKIPNLRC